jgi:hypothetical protein
MSKSFVLADAVTKIVYFSLIVATLLFVSMLLLTCLHLRELTTTA